MALFDHLASTHPVPLPSLQLIGLACLLLSSKFCLPFHSQPSISLLLSLTPGLYSDSQLRDAELACLARLGWNVHIITPTHFIDAWHLHPRMSPTHPHLLPAIDHLDRLSLHVYDLRASDPALIACGVVHAARAWLGMAETASDLAMGCDYGDDEVKACAHRLLIIAYHGASAQAVEGSEIGDAQPR